MPTGPRSRVRLMEMHPVFLFLDPYLIWFYRLTGHAALNFLLGTLVVASLAFLVGEFTSFLASSWCGVMSDGGRRGQKIPGFVHGGPEGRGQAGL